MKLRLAFAAAFLTTAATAAPLPPGFACHVGTYAGPGGAHLTLSGGENGRLGYLLGDERGGLAPAGPDRFAQAPPRAPLRLAFTGCGPDVRVAEGAAPEAVFRRLTFAETTLAVPAGDLVLSGKLVLPLGPVRKVAVFVDGSDQIGAADRTYWQYELPRRGIGVFVLDKRGTGASGGQPTANFHLRADDVLAAVRAVRARVGPKVGVGLIGFSQGGWVAPLAASKAPVDFVMVAYGMAEGVTAEDREEIVQNLEAAGFGPRDIAEAMELQAAASEVAKSHWTRGWERLDALKARYAKAAWVKALGNEGFTGMVFQMPSDLARKIAPTVDLGVSFEYEPAPVIAALKTRQLWVLGGDDHSAPSVRTLAILTDIQKTNPTLAVAVFPKADHGITETAVEAGVTRIRLSPGYIDLIARWIEAGRAPPTTAARVQPARR